MNLPSSRDSSVYFNEGNSRDASSGAKYDDVLAQNLLLSIDKSIKKEQRSK